MEEVLSRLVSLVISVAFFAIFVLAKPDQTINLNTKDLSIWFVMFWFVYECIGFLLHSLFIYFGRNSVKKDTLTMDNLNTDNHSKGE